MHTLTAGAGLAGALAGIPVAAMAYDTRPTGPVRLRAHWWTGRPAPPWFVAGTAATTGTASATIAAVVPPTPALPAFWLFAVFGVGLAIIDLRCRRLPHRLTGALWASSGLGFATTAIASQNAAPLLRAAGAGAATATVMLVIAIAMPGQLGLGDVALAGAINFNLGWLNIHAAIVGLLAGLTLHGVAAITLRLRQTAHTLTPMGPALLTGWLLGILYATT